VPSWLLVVSLAAQAACSLSLHQGDRALAESRYVDAAAAYGRTWSVEEDAALFRLGLIHAVPESPLFDPARARSTFEELQRRYPKSAYGFAGKVMAARLQRQQELEARLAELDGTLAQTKQSLSEAVSEHERDRQTRQAQLDQLQQERDRLAAELKGMRDEHAELVLLRQEHVDVEQLRRDNARMKEELEELKRIDLRR
jgi:vacuolar-type H+-ATPase subunit I/STV1